LNVSNKEIIESQWPIGSVWRRWDLHIHTPLSMLGSPYAGVSFSDFINELEKKSTERSMSVIGVTDYMTIDGYTKLHEEKYCNNRLTSIDLLIPNIEFRMMPQTADGKALNLHLLVDPVAENHIERINAALRNLRVDYDGQIMGVLKMN
jgi:predicted metal-dependent phosphoesterase TrpH